MSLSEEKRLILKMLEEGKISGEEAAKLLEALEGSTTKQSSGENFSKQQKQPNFQDEVAKVKDRLEEWKKEFKKNYNQKDFEHMIDEFSNKAEKLGKNVASTTFSIVDKVVDFVGSFVDTNAFNIFGSYNVVEKSFEAVVNEGADISLEAINGSITVKKHLDNKVVIKSKVRSPLNNADEILVFSEDPNTLSLKLNKIGNISVSHEVFLPAVKFNKIKLESSNGKIYVEDTSAQVLESITKNGSIDLMGINSDTLFVSTKNAKIMLSYVIGKKIDINTNNSIIDIKNVKTENIKAITINGKISAENVQCFNSSTEINMYLKTTNGGIKVNMNDMDDKGYRIKGQTTNGGINLLIPELTYHNINKQGSGRSFVEAETNGFNNYTQKVHIDAETTNGYIEIVK